MQAEISKTEKNKTQELLSKPRGKNTIGANKIFRTKYNFDYSANKHKTMFVVKDYVQ